MCIRDSGEIVPGVDHLAAAGTGGHQLVRVECCSAVSAFEVGEVALHGYSRVVDSSCTAVGWLPPQGIAESWCGQSGNRSLVALTDGRRGVCRYGDVGVEGASSGTLRISIS